MMESGRTSADRLPGWCHALNCLPKYSFGHVIPIVTHIIYFPLEIRHHLKSASRLGPQGYDSSVAFKRKELSAIALKFSLVATKLKCGFHKTIDQKNRQLLSKELKKYSSTR